MRERERRRISLLRPTLWEPRFSTLGTSLDAARYQRFPKCYGGRSEGQGKVVRRKFRSTGIRVGSALEMLSSEYKQLFQRMVGMSGQSEQVSDLSEQVSSMRNRVSDFVKLRQR